MTQYEEAECNGRVFVMGEGGREGRRRTWTTGKSIGTPMGYRRRLIHIMIVLFTHVLFRLLVISPVCCSSKETHM